MCMYDMIPGRVLCMLSDSWPRDHETRMYPGTVYKTLRSASGIRRPLRLLRKEKYKYDVKRTEVHDCRLKLAS